MISRNRIRKLEQAINREPDNTIEDKQIALLGKPLKQMSTKELIKVLSLLTNDQ